MIIRIIKKIRKLLTKHQKVRVFELMILMVIGAFVELLSVSMVLPFISAITDSKKAMKKWYVQLFCDWFHIESPQMLMGILAIILAVLFILKNLYLIFQKNIQNRFVYNALFQTRKKLLHDFIHRPYEYFLSVKSGEVMRMINNDVRNTFSLLTSLLTLATELIVSATLIIALLIISPGITIAIAAILLAAVFVIAHFLKPVMRRAGKLNQRTTAQLNRWLLQSIQGIKEIKVMQKEKYFEKNYDKNGKIQVKTLRTSKILTILPKYILEGLLMSSMFVIVSIIIFRGEDLSNLVPTLSVIAMAAIRLLPSANSISSSLSDAAFKEPMLDRTLENLDGIDSRREEKAEEKRSEIEEELMMVDVNTLTPIQALQMVSDLQDEIRKREEKWEKS